MATPPQRGQAPVQMSYEQREREQTRQRYEEYLDEQDSEKLPNVFDLGWKRNLLHLLGPSPLLWFFPICNTTGDGWSWEASAKWVEARERLRREREAQQQREANAGWGGHNSFNEPPPPITTVNATRPTGGSSRPVSKADRILGRDPSLYADGMQNVPMTRLNQRGQTVDDILDEIDDEEHDETARLVSDRAEAERKALDVVTNGGGWTKGGASGMLKKGGGSPRSPDGEGRSGDRFHDEGVD